MKSGEYWKQRFSILEASQNSNAVKAYVEIDQQFRMAQKEIESQISTWYSRFAKNNQISMAEARQWLGAKDLAEFKWDVKEYIKYGQQAGVNPVWMKQLENASAKFHISRLEALKVQTRQSVEKAFTGQYSTANALLKKTYLDGYYHTAYEINKGFNVGWDIAAINDKQLEMILSKPWSPDGKTFSDNIWKDKQALLSQMHTQLSQNIILGKSPDDSIKQLAKLIGETDKKGARFKAGRLVMTESAYFSALAQKDAFRELGVEDFEVIETLDSSTCSICGAMDGKHFPMSQFEPGVTVPPFHPFCRGCTAPYFDDDLSNGERAARAEDGSTYYVPDDMTYEDWKDKFVDGGSKYESRQEGFGVSVPESVKGDFSDFKPLELTAEEKESLTILHNLTKETGHEHGNTIIGGKAGEPFTSGMADRIQISKDILNGDDKIQIFHSHTNLTPPSSADFKQLLHEHVDKIGVIAYNGDVFVVSVGGGWVPDADEFKAATERIKNESLYSIAEDSRFLEWSESERNYMAIREQAFQIARYFEWIMEGGNIYE